jgi:hypothetical protein
VKTILRNRIEDGFMNNYIICFVEPGSLTSIPMKDVIVHFYMMEDCSGREKLQEVTTIFLDNKR